MTARLVRGEIYRLSPAPGTDPKRARCVTIVSRQTPLDSRADKVVCAPVNTRYDGLATQVPVGTAEGRKHEACINRDQHVLNGKARLTNYVGSLPTAKRRALREALRIALDVE